MKHRREGLVLGAVMATSAFGIDMMSPALADLAADLAISAQKAQWALSCAVAGFAMGQIPAGLLADRYGRRELALVALAVFALASVAGAMAANLELLLVTRFVQGLCGGALGVAARAIARDLASGDQAGHLLATMTTVLAVINIAAPLAGGALAGWFGWRAVLWAVAAYNVVNFWLAWRQLPASVHGPQLAETAWRQMRRSAAQFVRSRQSVLGTLINALAFAGLFSMVTGGALVAMDVYALSAPQAGIAMAGIPLMLMMGSIASRQLMLRMGLARMFMTAVGVLLIAGLWSLVNGFVQPAALMAGWAPFMCYGLAFGILMPTVAAVVTDPLPATAGFAASLLGTMQASFGTVASLVTALVYDGTLRPLTLIVAGCALTAALIYLVSGPARFVIAGHSQEV